MQEAGLAREVSGTCCLGCGTACASQACLTDLQEDMGFLRSCVVTEFVCAGAAVDFLFWTAKKENIGFARQYSRENFASIFDWKTPPPRENHAVSGHGLVTMQSARDTMMSAGMQCLLLSGEQAGAAPTAGAPCHTLAH